MQKQCIIIGVGPGMGAALARRFGREGFDLRLFARSRAEDVAKDVAAEGLRATAASLDASDPAAVAAALGTTPCDVLIYNAAGVTQATPMQLSIQALERDFRTSVASALAAAQAVAPGMIARGTGTILLTGGGFALRPMAMLASLGIGKAALRNLAFAMAEELKPKNIRVGTVTILGTVAPGTPFDPAAIADAFHALHEDRTYAHGVELQFTGASAA